MPQCSYLLPGLVGAGVFHGRAGKGFLSRSLPLKLPHPPALTGGTFPSLHLARGWPSSLHLQFFYNEPQRWVSGDDEPLAAAGRLALLGLIR